MLTCYTLPSYVMSDACTYFVIHLLISSLTVSVSCTVHTQVLVEHPGVHVKIHTYDIVTPYVHYI